MTEAIHPQPAGDSTPPTDGRRRIAEFLAAVDSSLTESGVAADQRQNVIDDLGVQIDDMLAAAGASATAPTVEQVQTVLSELDPPESYAGAAEEDAPTDEARAAHATAAAPASDAQAAREPVGAGAFAGDCCGGRGGGENRPRGAGRGGPGCWPRGQFAGPRWWGWKWRQRRQVAHAIWHAVDRFGPFAHPMFANYTDRARNAVAAAKAEARRLNHDYIGTEHVLIGLMAESGGGVVTTLSGMGFDIHLARTVVDKFARSAPTPAAAAALLPLTPKARRALAYARFSSRDTGGKQVDAEHVLLGLLEIPDGLAYQMLEQSGVSIAALREQIGKIVQSRPASTPPVPTPAAATFWAAGTGRTWQPGGALAGQSWKLIAGGDDTGGSHTAFDVTFTPSPTTAEARTITMERFDVSIYVLEGSLTILAADRSFAADAGAFVRIPRGTPHSITATTASRAMVMTTPGGSEKWIADFGRTAAEDEK